VSVTRGSATAVSASSALRMPAIKMILIPAIMGIRAERCGGSGRNQPSASRTKISTAMSGSM
jgi:hypothetical protein